MLQTNRLTNIYLEKVNKETGSFAEQSELSNPPDWKISQFPPACIKLGLIELGEGGVTSGHQSHRAIYPRHTVYSNLSMNYPCPNGIDNNAPYQ